MWVYGWMDFRTDRPAFSGALFYMSGQFSRLLGRLQEHEQETLRMQRVEDMLHRLEKELRDDVEAVRLRVDGSLDKHTQAMNTS